MIIRGKAAGEGVNTVSHFVSRLTSHDLAGSTGTIFDYLFNSLCCFPGFPHARVVFSSSRMPCTGVDGVRISRHHLSYRGLVTQDSREHVSPKQEVQYT
jgi:hypothetical protein